MSHFRGRESCSRNSESKGGALRRISTGYQHAVKLLTTLMRVEAWKARADEVTIAPTRN